MASFLAQSVFRQNRNNTIRYDDDLVCAFNPTENSQ